jgi:hypothetical protein
VFREPRPEDVAPLAANLRQADIDEAHAAGVYDMHAVIADGMRDSLLAWTITVDDDVIAMLGVCPLNGSLLDDVGIIWMLGTEGVRKHSRALMKAAPSYIAAMQRAFPTLLNIVFSENKTAVNWLGRMGFVLEPAEPLGPNGEMFHRFSMKAASCVTQNPSSLPPLSSVSVPPSSQAARP